MDTCVFRSTSVRVDAGSQVKFQTPFIFFFATVPPKGVWSFRRFRPDEILQDEQTFFLSAKKPFEVTYCNFAKSENYSFRYQLGRGARAATSPTNYLARRLVQVPNLPEFNVRRTPENWAPVQAYGRGSWLEMSPRAHQRDYSIRYREEIIKEPHRRNLRS